MEIARRYLAEFVGTFAFVFIGSMVVAVGGERLGGGAATVVIAAFGHGLILMAMIYALGAISGAHFNPAVTIALAALRKISLPDAGGYIIFQLLGAVVAVLFHAAILTEGASSYGLTVPAPDITDGAVEASVKLSDRYITGRFLPDKAIDVMDEAGARARIAAMTRPPEVKGLESEIEEIKEQKEKAIKEQDFEGAASMRDKEKTAKEKLEAVLDAWRKDSEEQRVTVDEDCIMHIVAKWTGIPLKRMERDEAKRLLEMEKQLEKIIIGQGEAVNALCKALRRSRADLKDPKRPIGSFALLGPTGVGKTLLAKTIAEQMFGSAKSLIQMDMSEYMEKFTTSRLTGSPPGYVGYEEGGQLTEKVRQNPYSVVLFDEMEKAHPDVSNMLLQILEEGKLTDSLGRVIDFRNTIILLTSNVGSEALANSTKIGFTNSSEEISYERLKSEILDASKKAFRPEFLNRLDDLIVFRPLSKSDLVKILKLEIEKVTERLSARNIHLEVDEKAIDFLVTKGYDPQYGARPMRRAVERHLEDPLAEEILRGNLHENEPVLVTLGEDKLIFTQKTSASGEAVEK